MIKMVMSESLTPNSGIEAHFKCNEGHSFKRKIQQFTANQRCPECELIKKHSIAIKKPEMLVFWDFEKNTLSPYRVTPYSKAEAYWKCKKCDYEWKAVIANRAAATKNKCSS